MASSPLSPQPPTGSISSSGDEEYDSRSPFLNHHPSQLPQPCFLSSSHFQTHPNSLFDLSSPYLHHALSHQQSQPNSSFLNLDNTATSSSSQPRPSEPDHHCTEPPALVIPSSTPPPVTNQCLLTPPDNARVLPSPARNSKKRTRASRRAPTTVLTTDTTNFRAMVQEFTGIPAPPFSGSSYSRRLDLLTVSRSSSSHHLDSTTPFYPLRPSPQKFQNPSMLFSSSSLLHNNVVDAIASSSGTSHNNNNNLVNHHQLPLDLAYHYQNPNMLSMQNHYPPFGNTNLPFASRPQGNLSVFEDLGGVSHVSAQVGVTVPTAHGHVTSDQANDDGSCKLNFNSGSAASTTLEKSLENNNNININININNNSSTTRGEGTAVDSWICSSD